MSKFIGKACLVIVGLAAAVSASAAATVTYINPEKMTDVPRFSSDRCSLC